MSEESIVDGFIGRKKADSQWLQLEDGESANVVKLVAVKPILKTGFDGKEKEVLRFICNVETKEGVKEKFFDNGTQRFATEMQAKGIKVGSGFTLTRNGLLTKTRYTITNITNGANAPLAPAPVTPQASLANHLNGEAPAPVPTPTPPAAPVAAK